MIVRAFPSQVNKLRWQTVDNQQTVPYDTVIGPASARPAPGFGAVKVEGVNMADDSDLYPVDGTDEERREWMVREEERLRLLPSKDLRAIVVACGAMLDQEKARRREERRREERRRDG
jgi:hypothetical protein